MSYIGIRGAERLDMNDSSMGLIKCQREAIDLLRKGVDMHSIKHQTGWETGIDGKWRYEIYDPFHTTEKIEDYIKRHFGEPINIRYCMHDTTLLIAYPAFERLRLFAMYTPTRQFAGYFNPKEYAMMVCMGTTNSPFEFQTEGVLLHEVQHLIQEEENFARGGDNTKGGLRYMRLAGEVEARNICLRHELSPEQRRQMLRSDTQDMPDHSQIIVFL